MALRAYMILVTVLLGWSARSALAGDFDGTKLMTCTCIDGLEYHRNGGRNPFHPESVGLPNQFVVDFKGKIIRPTKESVIQRRSKIKRSERVEDKLILQGAEDGVEGVDDGVGWSMAIEQRSGRFVISASGGHVGYIVFGGCLVQAP